MKILLQWATGLGKTKAALDMCKQVYTANNKAPYVLILVAETTHIQNWIDEIKKWKVKTIMKRTTFSCYNSISKHENKKYDIIILDECHHCFSERRLDSFDKLIYDNIILLSATLTYDEINILKSKVRGLQIDTKSLNTAINQGKLKDPELIIKDYHLKPVEKTQYISICKRYDWASNNRNEKLKRMFAIQRKKLLANFKTPVLKETVESLRKEGTKFICYCASINQMIEVSDGINCVSSKQSKKTTQQTIDKFNNDEISELFFCQMGVEGLNLSGIEVGVICQCDANTRPFIQKIGRVLRNKVNPRIIICRASILGGAFGIVPATKDEDWVNDCINQIKY